MEAPASDGEASAAAPAAAPLPKCRCGYDRHHLMVSAEGRYTLWGWFWVTFVGVTTRPIRVEYRCRVCGETFDSTTDDAALTANT